jgi:hypothetical protein
MFSAQEIYSVESGEKLDRNSGGAVMPTARDAVQEGEPSAAGFTLNRKQKPPLLQLGGRQACMDIVKTAPVEIVRTDGRDGSENEQDGFDYGGTPSIQRRGEARVDKEQFFFKQEVEEGNIEYKLKLTDVSEVRLQHLVTQLNWRLREGKGTAIYQLGVRDDGFPQGVTKDTLVESLYTLSRMANELGASAVLMCMRARKVRLEDDSGRVHKKGDGKKRRGKDKKSAGVRRKEARARREKESKEREVQQEKESKEREVQQNTDNSSGLGLALQGLLIGEDEDGGLVEDGFELLRMAEVLVVGSGGNGHDKAASTTLPMECGDVALDIVEVKAHELITHASRTVSTELAECITTNERGGARIEDEFDKEDDSVAGWENAFVWFGASGEEEPLTP